MVSIIYNLSKIRKQTIDKAEINSKQGPRRGRLNCLQHNASAQKIFIFIFFRRKFMEYENREFGAGSLFRSAKR